MYRLLLVCFIFAGVAYAGDDKAVGKFFNPITDPSWKCLYPITISGAKISGKGADIGETKKKPVCFCAGFPVPVAGAPLSFWEPMYMVDVTRTPGQMVSLGGIKLFKGKVNKGTEGNDGAHYHVHWYVMPIFLLLENLSNFFCYTQGDLGVGYMSEIDPTWNNESLALFLNPEAFLFSIPQAQLACVADCAASSARKPIDKLFWCGGCEGSVYPFTGFVNHNVGGIKSSSLMVHRIIAKLHRLLVLANHAPNNYCMAELAPIIKKSIYKTQLVYPVTEKTTSGHPLGETDVVWGSGKSFPIKGEDFAYLIWRKKHCCLSCIPKVAG